MTSDLIEWVDIPAGEFTFGLGEHQLSQIREQLWADYGPLDEDPRAINLLRQLFDELSSRPFDQITPRIGLTADDYPLITKNRYVKLLSSTGMLRLQPRDTTVRLKAF
jgi:hypothetical protein